MHDKNNYSLSTLSPYKIYIFFLIFDFNLNLPVITTIHHSVTILECTASTTIVGDFGKLGQLSEGAAETQSGLQ